tara:strand:- start:280 stop:552 length:273 start_codon:yes stop_codon:yes gene_type:complete
MKKPTINHIIKEWISNRLDNGVDTIASHEVETTLVEYGKEYWGRLHSPSTWSRAWRQVRANNELDEIDVTSIEIVNTESAETTWRLKTGI